MLAWKGLSLKLVVSYLQKTKDSILKSLHVLLEHSARFCITIHILKIKSSSVWLRLLYRCIWLSTNSSTRTPQQNQKPPLNPRASNNFSGLNSTCSFFFFFCTFCKLRSEKTIFFFHRFINVSHCWTIYSVVTQPLFQRLQHRLRLGTSLPADYIFSNCTGVADQTCRKQV